MCQVREGREGGGEVRDGGGGRGGEGRKTYGMG